MDAFDVPRAEWKSFLEGFAAKHRDWMVNLTMAEKRDPGGADVREMAFSGIELKEDAGGHTEVTLETTEAAAGIRTTHTVTDLERVRLLKRPDGAEAALSLEGSQGSKVLMHFTAKHLEDPDIKNL